MFFKCIQRSFTTYKKFGSPFFDFEKLLRKTFFYRTPKANSGFWSLLDWNFLSKWDQICPPRDSACWAVYNKSFWRLQVQNQQYRIVFYRVLETWILINSNDSIARSNFSSLMNTMTFGTWFEVDWTLQQGVG